MAVLELDAPPAAVANTTRSVFDDDWIVLGRVAGPRLPSARSVDVARTFRKALMSAYGPDAPEILSGHHPSGLPSEHPHLAYVPLPSVADAEADGSIAGVALILPRQATHAQRFAVYRALDRWEAGVRATGGAAPSLPVHLGKTGSLLLTRIEGEALQAALRAPIWCSAAATWASATPVALDRNPGDLRSRDPAKEAEAHAEAEAIIARACERIGLPRPVRVTVVSAAPLAGAEPTWRFPSFKAGSSPVQRVLVHATLAFETPVRGPILLGAGRYFGLGLFRPLGDHA